jgi:hypothetical protein
MPSPLEKEHQGTQGIFQTFVAGVVYKKTIHIFFSPALLLELLGSTLPGILEWI